MNLLFTLNRRYLGILRVCLHSIIRFESRGGYDVYILASDLDSDDFAALAKEFPGVRFYPIDVDESRFSDFPESKSYPKQMYYRILAAKLLPERLDRVLYLDPDLVALHSLDELYSLDFDGCWFVAATHTKKALTRVNQVRLGAEKYTPYINSGVMLLNLKELRENQSERELSDYVNRYARRLILPDQDIISALYGDKIKLVDYMRYNLSDRMLGIYNADPANKKRGMRWVCRNTVIVHYCGKNKPWKPNYIGRLGVFYWMLEELYIRSDSMK